MLPCFSSFILLFSSKIYFGICNGLPDWFNHLCRLLIPFFIIYINESCNRIFICYIFYYAIPTESPFCQFILTTNSFFIQLWNNVLSYIVHGTLLFLLFFLTKKFAAYFHNCHPLCVSISFRNEFHFYLSI